MHAASKGSLMLLYLFTSLIRTTSRLSSKRWLERMKTKERLVMVMDIIRQVLIISSSSSTTLHTDCVGGSAEQACSGQHPTRPYSIPPANS